MNIYFFKIQWRRVLTAWDKLSVNVLLALIMVAVLVAITLSVLLQPIVSWFLAATPNIAREQAYPITLPARVLSASPLFGRYKENIFNLPLSSLPYSLVGITLELNNPHQSRALLMQPNQAVSVYKVGDVLQKNVKIQYIFKDFIVINHDKRLERINLPLPKINSTLTAVKAANSNTAALS